MAETADIREEMEVVGSDGIRVGIVADADGNHIKLAPGSTYQAEQEGHEHYLPRTLVASVEGNQVRLSTKAEETTLVEVNAHPSAARTPITSDRPVWNWNRIGVGAAALGVAAAAGAVLLSRRSRDDDFQLRLETDENVRLIASDKVEGTAVVDRDGKKLGHIKSFMVDKYTGRVAYAVMSLGEDALFPLPWPLLDYDVEKDGYALQITREEMAKAPRFKANDAPEFDAEYRRSVIAFYRPGSTAA
jgi:hypothetical protein